MKTSQSISQKTSLQLGLHQNLQNSLEILSLSQQELQERIQKEILENPILEEGPISGKEINTNSHQDNKRQFMENAIPNPETLGDHLLSQWQLYPLSESQNKIGKIIISDLDDNGFLTHNLSHLFDPNSSQQKEVKYVLSLIQNLDPIGCGTKNIQEALLIQARKLRPEDTKIQILIEKYFHKWTRLDWREIEKETKFSTEEIKEALLFLRSLEAHPGALYSKNFTQHIIPDLIVTKINKELEIFNNEEYLSQIQINASYQTLLKKTKPESQERAYLKKKYSTAKELLFHIARRKKTLLGIGERILVYQKEFFLKGNQYLRPLVLREIASDLNIHESTVSRSIVNKYLQCEWGYFKLKYFFSAKLQSINTQKKDISSRSVKERIKQLISKESPSHILSDEAIVSILEKEDIKIARRTVAKYRKQLGLASPRQRKNIAKLLSMNLEKD